MKYNKIVNVWNKYNIKIKCIKNIYLKDFRKYSVVG